MFDPAFTYYQVVNKCLMSNMVQNPSSSLVFRDDWRKKSHSIFVSFIIARGWGWDCIPAKHSLRLYGIEAPWPALMAMGRGSAPDAICMNLARLSDFYIDHCAALFHSQIFDHSLNFWDKMSIELWGKHKHFSVKV